MEGSVNARKQSEGLKVNGKILGAMMGHVTQDNLMMNAKTRKMVTH